jgi:WD40 repeat protein
MPLGPPLTGHTGPVVCGPGVPSRGRPVLATGDGDGTVRLWDAEQGTALGDLLTGHTLTLRWAAWGAIGGRPVLATCGDDRSVRLWEVIEDRPAPRRRHQPTTNRRPDGVGLKLEPEPDGARLRLGPHEVLARRTGAGSAGQGRQAEQSP